MNVAGTTVAVRVLSSGVDQTETNPNFTQGQTIPRGNVGGPSTMARGTGPRLGVRAGPSSTHSDSFARQSTTTIQVSCFVA